MKKWTIAASLSACGSLIFVITSVMVGRFDRWQIADAASHGYSGGQFNGAGQAILHWIFFWLLLAIAAVGLIAFGVSALIKWRSRALVRTSYVTLYYWCGLVPVVTFLVLFPAWALWRTVGDCMKYMK
jgi:hypothetical protein